MFIFTTPLDFSAVCARLTDPARNSAITPINENHFFITIKLKDKAYSKHEIYT